MSGIGCGGLQRVRERLKRRHRVVMTRLGGFVHEGVCSRNRLVWVDVGPRCGLDAGMLEVDERNRCAPTRKRQAGKRVAIRKGSFDQVHEVGGLPGKGIGAPKVLDSSSRIDSMMRYRDTSSSRLALARHGHQGHKSSTGRWFNPKASGRHDSTRGLRS